MPATERRAPSPSFEDRVARRRQPRSVWQTHAGRWLAAATGALLVATVVGLVALWPAGRGPHVPAAASVGATLHVGEAIRVQEVGGTWGFADVDRRAPLLWLAVAVAALAVVLVRWRGILAIAGLARSLLLVTHFVLPAILDGRPALLVGGVSDAMAATHPRRRPPSSP